jgi:hypothetical protein
MDFAKDDLKVFNYDGHKWEVGFFGDQNNRFCAYGFRQDDMVIRITSKYEAKVFADLLSKVTA